MLDFDAGKLLIIGVVALVVIGPKDLPRVLRQVGQMVAKLRRMAGEFQGQFMDAMKEADLQDLRDQVAKIKDTATLDVNFDPARDLRSELTGAIDASSSSAVGKTNPVASASGTAVVHDPVPSNATLAAGPAMDEVSFTPGSTSEGHAFGLPPVGPANPNLTALATGIAPVPETPVPETSIAENPVKTVATASSDQGAPHDEADSGMNERRKILVPRRRTPARFDPAQGVAAGRSRIVRPVRPETADR
jgi:sec-independent protein translocase protein TatB